MFRYSLKGSSNKARKPQQQPGEKEGKGGREKKREPGIGRITKGRSEREVESL